MKPKSILIVDDEESILKTLSFNLTNQGYQVDIAYSGEEGINKFRKQKHDLVITDLIMMKMDGIEVLKTVKKIKKDTMAIVLTGFGSLDSAVEALRLGAFDYLVKPCDREELSLKVAKCLHEQDLARQVDKFNVDLVSANASLLDETSKCQQSKEKLKRYAAELERSNKELESFACVASHDLQEPLRKIILFGDMLLENSSHKNAEEKVYLKKVKITAERMEKLIDDLLDFSRVLSHGKTFKSVDMNAVIGEVLDNLEIMISKSKATVNVENMPSLQVDPSQMKRLFQNLIGNALKFHAKDRPSIVELTCKQDEKGDWAFRIKDNGIGIKEEYLSTIFKPFERLHGSGEYEGTGMGLAICQKIASCHGGGISVSSAEGKGSVFTVTLPGAPK